MILAIQHHSFLNLILRLSFSLSPARGGRDDIKLALDVLSRMRSKDLALPIDWSNTVPLQVSDVMMAHVASKGYLHGRR